MLTGKEFQRLLQESPPTFLLGTLEPMDPEKVSKIHIFMASDHSLTMLRYDRQLWDTLCQKQKDSSTMNLLEPHPDEMTEDLRGQLCPKCVYFARRLLAARKAIEGQNVRYLEEHHV